MIKPPLCHPNQRSSIRIRIRILISILLSIPNQNNLTNPITPSKLTTPLQTQVPLLNIRPRIGRLPPCNGIYWESHFGFQVLHCAIVSGDGGGWECFEVGELGGGAGVGTARGEGKLEVERV